MNAQRHHWVKSLTSLSDTIASFESIRIVNASRGYYQMRNHAMTTRANAIALDSLENTYVSGFYSRPLLIDSFRFNNNNFHITKIDFYGNTKWVKTFWANFPINILDIVPVHNNRFVFFANVLLAPAGGINHYDLKICLNNASGQIPTSDTITFETTPQSTSGGYFIIEFDSTGKVLRHQKIFDFQTNNNTEIHFQTPNSNAFVDRNGCLIFLISANIGGGHIYTRNNVIPSSSSSLTLLKYNREMDSLLWEKDISDFGIPLMERGMPPKIALDTNSFIYVLTLSSGTFQFKGLSYDVGLRTSLYGKGFLTILKPNAELLYSEFFSQFDNSEFRKSRDGILSIYPVDTNEIYINGFFPDTLRIKGQKYYREDISDPDFPFITNPNATGYGRYSSLCLLSMGIHKVHWVSIPHKKVDQAFSGLIYPHKPDDLINYSMISNMKNGVYTSFNCSRNTNVSVGGLTIDLDKETSPKIVFAKFDTLGNALWLKQGVGVKGMQVTELGELIYCGSYQDSVDFEPFALSAANLSGFVAKFMDYAITRGPVSAGPYCAGDSILVPYTKMGDFDTANWFIAELSDEHGNFEGGHRELGRLKSTQDGVIMGTLPMFQVVSSGRYRIRVRATDPAVQSYYWEDTLQLLIYSRDKADPGPQEFLCLGDSMEIQTFGGTQWEWSPNQFMMDSTARKTLVFPPQTTTYRIVISDSSGCGEADTAFKTIIVRDKPVIFSNKTNYTACVGDTIRIPASFANGDTSHFRNSWFAITGIRWMLGSTSSALINDTFTFVVTANMPNSQRIALVLTDDCHPLQDTVFFNLQRARNNPSPASISTLDSGLICPEQPAILLAHIPDIPNMQWAWLNALGDTLKIGSNATTDSLKIVPQWFQNQPQTYRIVTQNNCVGRTDTSSFQWFPPSPLKVSPNVTDTLVCAYSELTLFASGTGGDSLQYQYQWIFNGSILSTDADLRFVPSIDPSPSTIQLVLSDNCMPQNDTAEITVRVKPALRSAILREPHDDNEHQDDNAVQDTTVCSGSELQFFAKASGGDSSNYSFEWLFNDSLIGTDSDVMVRPSNHHHSPSTLHLITQDACSPPDTQTITINILPPLSVTLRHSKGDTLCAGEEITLFAQATGGIDSAYSYQWLLNGAFVSDLDSFLLTGIHPSPSTLQLILSDGCSSPNDTFTHTFFVRPSLSIDLSASTLCANPTTTLTANPSGGKADNYTIQWFDEAENMIGTGSSLAVTPTQLTTYHAILREGCSQTQAKAQIQIDRLPDTLILSASPTEGCEPLEIEFEIYTNYRDSFSGVLYISDTDSLIIENLYGRIAIRPNHLKTGIYTPSFQFISKLGCTGVSQYDPTWPNAPTITVHPKPTAAFSFEPDSPRLDNPEIRFQNLSTGATSYQWELPPLGAFTDFEPTVRYSETGRFSVMHIAISDQGCRDTAMGEVWIQKALRFFMPTAFSPNGDGINDALSPSVLGLEVIEFNIFNRWGERIFSSKGQAWDGTYRGQPVQGGVYTYTLVLKEENGKQMVFSGTVSVLR
jgi:gliding motility-associated-like protein